MADKNFLLEHNLTEAYKDFMRLCNENTFFSGVVEEEGEDEQNQDQNPDAMGGDPNMGGGGPAAMGGDPNMGGDPAAMGSDPNMMGDPNAMGGDPAAMGGSPNMMDDPNAMGGDPAAMGGDPNMMGDPGMDPMGVEPGMEDLENVEEDDVIDVDDITNAQEKTSARVNKVGRNLDKVDDKIVDIMGMIKNLSKMIDSNNAKIAEFQQEFEKRNPTPVEQLNLRSLDSFPFNENPKKYWEKKGTQPYVSGNRYEAYSDNDEPVAKKEYVITNDDLKDVNPSEIKDTFHIDDDLRSTIEKIFDL